MKLYFVCCTCIRRARGLPYFATISCRPFAHHFSLSCFRSGETSHIRSCKSNIYRGDQWCIPLASRHGDYRLQCLQAIAHVRVHFRIDGRRRDNKAIRTCVREAYCNTRPICLNYKMYEYILDRTCFLKLETLESISYHKSSRNCFKNVQFYKNIIYNLKNILILHVKKKKETGREFIILKLSRKPRYAKCKFHST